VPPARLLRSLDGCTLPFVTGYAFISYSHHDRDYVQRLSAALKDAGVDPWFDESINHGAKWGTVLQDKIDGCSAFLVVMSSVAETSSWMENEIIRAQDTRRPIFPLLLEGRPFFRLNNLQYESVTGATMPGEAFVSAVRETCEDAPTETSVGEDVASASTFDGDGDEAFFVRRYVYSRVANGAIQRRVFAFLRGAIALGTKIDIGRSPRTVDGRTDYLMVRDRGPQRYGSVVYLRPANGGLTLRLRRGDVAFVDDPHVRPRDVADRDPYQVNCPLSDDDAVQVALHLTKLALAKVRARRP
jgi:TIR domain-containing protein